MIISAFLLLIYGFLTLFVSILPSSTGFSAEGEQQIITLFAYLFPFDFLISFTNLFLVATAFFLFHTLLGVWFIFNWVIKKVPGMS